MSKYEGWANFHTWNVALWIANEEPLYLAAVAYADEAGSDATYLGYVESSLVGQVTPDGISWTDPSLDHAELDGFIRGLIE